MSQLDHASFLEALRQLSSKERMEFDRAYHKSSREHWGVTLPLCDQAIRTLSANQTDADLRLIAKQLWQTNIYDPMIMAARILALPQVKPDLALWKTIKNFMKDVDGWALEDNLAKAAWKCILANEELLDDLEKWTSHKNFWMRRAALVFTLPYAKKGRDPERMLGWAAGYANDPEWFIQKAIGWWLRDLGAHNPARVIKFLSAHWNDLKYVARKEATRKLSDEWLKKLDKMN